MISLKSPNWQINNIDTILFDKDGTFIDLHYFWGKMTELRAEAVIKYTHIDYTMKPLLCSYLGYSLEKSKMQKNGITALYSRSQIIDIFSTDLKKHNIFLTKEELERIFDKVSNEFYKKMYNYIKPIDSAINFIKKVHKLGVKTGIVTSDTAESTILTLRFFGWEDLFSTIIGRESCANTKESGKPTLLALDHLNADSQNSLMIGDAPMDYISAKNAGIDKVILVATGQLSSDDLSKTTNFVVNSLDDLNIIY